MLISVIILCALLALKSLIWDIFPNEESYGYLLAERSFSFHQGLPIDTRIVSIALNEHKHQLNIRARKYLLYIFPIGDRFETLDLSAEEEQRLQKERNNP